MLSMAPLVPLKPYLLDYAGEDESKEKKDGVLFGMGITELVVCNVSTSGTTYAYL